MEKTYDLTLNYNDTHRVHIKINEPQKKLLYWLQENKWLSNWVDIETTLDEYVDLT